MPVPAVWFWDINPNPNNRSAPFWRLSQLRLRQSGLTGALPASWYLPFLGMLDLSSNPGLNGTFYSPLVVNTSLPRPPSVSWLNLSFTGLSGNLSHPSLNWSSVQVLSLRGNSLVNGLLPGGHAASLCNGLCIPHVQHSSSLLLALVSACRCCRQVFMLCDAACSVFKQ